MQAAVPNRTGRPHTPALAFVLFAILFAAFLPSLRNGFVAYDDPDYVTANWHVLQGLSWTGLKWAFTTFHAANWHPLTWLSHQADVQVFGQQAWGHHLTSVLLHACNGVILFLALRALTGSSWRSFLVALCFGLHPLRVESVAWIAERKDVLSATFFLLTVLLYAKWARRDANADSAKPALANKESLRISLIYWGALFLFCLGVLSKPMVVTLPCVLLVLDYWPLQRLDRGRWPALLLEKVPFFIAASVGSFFTVLAQQGGGAIVQDVSLSGRVQNAFVAYARYLGKLFWPSNLSPFYPPVAEWPALVTVGSVLLFLAVGCVVFVLRKQRSFLLTGWLWFAGMLVPVLGLIAAGEQSMADRYTYLPSIGIFIGCVWLLSDLLTGRAAWCRRGAVVIGSILIVSWAAVSWRQITCWRDTETLFTHALRATTGNYVALNNLGTAKDKQGHYDEALHYFQEAVRSNPKYAHAYNNMGVVYFETGRMEQALDSFQQALKIKPSYADARNNLGSVLDRLGRSDEALEQFAAACRLNAGHADAQYNLGLQLMRKGRFEEAIQHLTIGAQLQPGSADTHNNLGFAYQKLKQLDRAISHYQEAVRLRPDYARGHYNLGVALYERGLIDAAISEFQTALKLKPDYAEARKNLEALIQLRR